MKSERGEVAPPVEPPETPPVGNFFDGFAPEIKGHPSITRYKSTEELAKGHLELEKKIGLKGVMVPTDNSDDKTKSDFFKAIGRPDKSDGYANPTLDNLHEGVRTTTEQDLQAFKDKAHELGLSGKQFDNMYSWYLNMQSQRLTDYDNLQKSDRDKAGTELRQKYGAKFDENLALANGVMKKFGSDGLNKRIAELGSDPDIIDLLVNVGSQMSEDKLGEIGRSMLGLNPEQAKLEINSITKTIMETDQNDPLYKELMRKKDYLYKIAYPAK